MYIRFIWKLNKGKSYLNKNACYLVNIKDTEAPDIIIFSGIKKIYTLYIPYLYPNLVIIQEEGMGFLLWENLITSGAC